MELCVRTLGMHSRSLTHDIWKPSRARVQMSNRYNHINLLRTVFDGSSGLCCFGPWSPGTKGEANYGAHLDVICPTGIQSGTRERNPSSIHAYSLEVVLGSLIAQLVNICVRCGGLDKKGPIK